MKNYYILQENIARYTWVDIFEHHSLVYLKSMKKSLNQKNLGHVYRIVRV